VREPLNVTPNKNNKDKRKRGCVTRGLSYFMNIKTKQIKQDMFSKKKVLCY